MKYIVKTNLILARIHNSPCVFYGTIKNKQKEGITMSIKQELLEIIVAEVSQFNDFETYELFENVTKQEFLSNLQLGCYIDLTLESYNGHSNHFSPSSITNEHIYDSIVTCLYLIDYPVLSHTTKNLSEPELVYEFVSTYNVFTLNNRIYLKL